MNDLVYDMLAIAEEKYVQMRELLELTREHAVLLEKEEVESLGRHIGYKQNIMDRIDLLDARFMELSTRLQAECDVCSLEGLREQDGVKDILDLGLKPGMF